MSLLIRTFSNQKPDDIINASLDFIDDIKLLQNGSRRRFPLFLNGQLISFEKDNNDALSSEIDLDAVLIIFVNGVIQTPKIAYQFTGGTTVLFLSLIHI